MSGNRKARRLTLKGREYRWSLRGHRELTDGQCFQLLTVVSADSTGQALHVLVPLLTPWSFVQERMPPEQRDGLVMRGVGPGWVSGLVQLALSAGWNPVMSGPTLEFILVEGRGLVPLTEWSRSKGSS